MPEVAIKLTYPGHGAQMKEWCTTQFGPEQSFRGEKNRWCVAAGWNNYLMFRFPNEIDAMAFKLRWG